MKPSIQAQKGYVLLQVLLAFSVLAVLVVDMQYRQRVQIERVQMNLFLSQAQAYAESAEALAMAGMSLDKEVSKVDHLNEEWNIPGVGFPLDEGGFIGVEMNDMQGRFNLNWLSMENPKRADARKGFEKLLSILGHPTSIAKELYDWFDPDSGAQYNYLDQLPSYIPAATPMADVSELLLLKDVDRDILESLKPYVSALPADSALNVNTAPEEVLQTIAGHIGAQQAQDAINKRGEDGFRSPTDFLNQPAIKDNNQAGIYLDNLSVTSDWFEVFTLVTIGERTLTQSALLYRDEKGSAMIARRDRSATLSNPIAGDPVKFGAVPTNNSGVTGGKNSS